MTYLLWAEQGVYLTPLASIFFFLWSKVRIGLVPWIMSYTGVSPKFNLDVPYNNNIISDILILGENKSWGNIGDCGANCSCQILVPLV